MGKKETDFPKIFIPFHLNALLQGLAPGRHFFDLFGAEGFPRHLVSLQSRYRNNKIPLENFFDLFGEEGNKIPRKHLSLNARWQRRNRVSPPAKAFWGWLQGKGWEDDFASISGLLNPQGIPDTGNSEDPVAKGLEDFFDLFGEEESKIPRKHLSRFTSMHCGKGVVGLTPRAKAFWGWLQGKGWEDDFASISGLLTHQGIPDTGNSADPVARGLENFFDLFGEEEHKISRTHLSRFTSMHCGKGVKGLAPRAKAFWGWLQGKGWEDDFASISGLLTLQGIPDTGNSADLVAKGLENFFDLFGEEEHKIPRTHLSRFTSMHCGKGVKGLAPRAKTFWGWLQGKGWEADFASISGLLTINKEFPIPGTVQIQSPGAGKLFRICLGKKGTRFPGDICPVSPQCTSGKGVKGLAPRAQAFWDWLQGKGWVDDFASISGLLAKQGIPDTGNSADPVVKGLENFFDLFGEEENKIPRKHLSRFTSMHCGKGVPPVNQVLALWTWLDKDSVLLWQAARLFTLEGLPSLPTLNSSLDWLKQVTSWDGDDTMPLNTALKGDGPPPGCSREKETHPCAGDVLYGASERRRKGSPCSDHSCQVAVPSWQRWREGLSGDGGWRFIP